MFRNLRKDTERSTSDPAENLRPRGYPSSPKTFAFLHSVVRCIPTLRRPGRFLVTPERLGDDLFFALLLRCHTADYATFPRNYGRQVLGPISSS